MTQRINRGAILLDDEAIFCKATGLFAGNELSARMKEAKLENLSYYQLPDDADSHHGGVHASFKGSSRAVDGVPWSSMLEGLGGSGYGSAQAAVATAQTKLFAAAYQSEIELTTGDKTTALATTTVVPSQAAGDMSLAHAESIGLAVFTVVVGGVTKYQMAPYWWSSPDLNLLMALDAVPAENSIIYAGANLTFAQDWAFGALPKSLAIKYISTTLQNALIKGAVTSFSLGDTGPSETPRLAWKASGVHHSRGDVETYPTLADPPNVLPGWDLRLAAAGSTVTKSIASPRISWPEFTTWILDEDGNARDPDDGYPIVGSNWSRGLATAGFRVVCPQSETPPAACTSSTYEEMSSSQLAGDEVQALCACGRTPGRMASRYLHRCGITEWNGFQDNNGLLMQGFNVVPVDKLSAGVNTDAFYQPDIFNQS